MIMITIQKQKPTILHHLKLSYTCHFHNLGMIMISDNDNDNDDDDDDDDDRLDLFLALPFFLCKILYRALGRVK